MASEAEREAGRVKAEQAERDRWDAWVKIQEDAGYEVQGDSFQNAVVVGLPDGPTYDIEVP